LFFKKRNSPDLLPPVQIPRSTPVFDRIVSDSSRYYLLGYHTPPATGRPGYRRLEVQVNRPGIRIRARAGYYAIPRQP
jgi:hypothetical protein